MICHDHDAQHCTGCDDPSYAASHGCPGVACDDADTIADLRADVARLQAERDAAVSTGLLQMATDAASDVTGYALVQHVARRNAAQARLAHAIEVQRLRRVRLHERLVEASRTIAALGADLHRANHKRSIALRLAANLREKLATERTMADGAKRAWTLRAAALHEEVRRLRAVVEAGRIIYAKACHMSECYERCNCGLDELSAALAALDEGGSDV